MRRSRAVAIGLLAALVAPLLPFAPRLRFAKAARADDLSQGATYHADAARSGGFVAAGLTYASAATMHRNTTFGGVFSGTPKAQPLYWRAPGAAHGMVLVATSQDVVQAFDSVTGASLWQVSLGPVDTQSVPDCGAPRQVGILGTPVIDPAAGVLYALGSVQGSGGADSYALWAISLATGTVSSGWPVAIAPGIANLGQTFTPIAQDQHTALALIGGHVYAGFAANHGDCVPYHGWVVAVDTASATVSAAWQTRAVRGGVWAQGGVVSDGTSLFVATGNANESATWMDGEAVFRLPANLAPVTAPADYFVPANFQSLDQADLDLGSNAPVPVDVAVPGGGTAQWLFQIGKGGTAYVLDRAALGGVGGDLLHQAVAQPPVDTAPAAFAAAGATMVVFSGAGTQCPGSVNAPRLVALALSAQPGAAQPGAALRTAWCAGGSLTTGVPIVTTTDGTTDPIVWVTAPGGDHLLHGYRGDTGAVVFSGGSARDTIPGMQRYAAILVAEGRLFIAGTGRLYAFDYTPGL